MEATDEQLAREAMEGDAEAFGVLVRRLRAPLVGYLAGMVHPHEEAEELAQEALLVAWERLRSLRDPARVSGWIYGIARILAAKKASAVRSVPLADDPPARSGRCAREEQLASLMAAVGRLSGPHREVILRKHFGGYRGEQIARQLGVAPGTVRSRLSRAYSELRAMLNSPEPE